MTRAYIQTGTLQAHIHNNCVREKKKKRPEIYELKIIGNQFFLKLPNIEIFCYEINSIENLSREKKIIYVAFFFIF